MPAWWRMPLLLLFGSSGGRVVASWLICVEEPTATIGQGCKQAGIPGSRAAFPCCRCHGWCRRGQILRRRRHIGNAKTIPLALSTTRGCRHRVRFPRAAVVPHSHGKAAGFIPPTAAFWSAAIFLLGEWSFIGIMAATPSSEEVGVTLAGRTGAGKGHARNAGGAVRS
jgi:hypothetical protein